MDKNLEVRMYTRDRDDGLTELYFLDRTGSPRIVAQLEPGAIEVAIEHAIKVHEAHEPPPPAKRRPYRSWSMGHLLGRASMEPKEEPDLAPPDPPAFPPPLPRHDPPDMDDNMRRRAAKELVRRAVIEASQSTTDDQMRYELALQAHNDNVQALEMFAEEAKVAKVSAKELAERIITERRRRERRMMHIHAIQAQALIDLDNASGEAISTVERQAVAHIGQESRNA
jgi:hypothetical protein